MQVRTGTDAGTCGGGCKYVRLRRAKLALKSSTPILDKRKGMNDSTEGSPSHPILPIRNTLQSQRLIEQAVISGGLLQEETDATVGL